MNIKKGLIVIIIGAVTLGIMTSCVSADDPKDTTTESRTVDINNDETPDSSDVLIGIDNDERPWEDQPFWDDPNVKDGDLIIAPAPDNSEEGEQDYEEEILSGATRTEDETTIISSGMSVIGTVALIGLLGTALILLKRKKME